MEEIVGLSAKERARLVELEQVKAGRQTVVAAAERLSMSGRQGKRIWKRYRAEGAKGLVHRARGRPSNRKLDPDSKRQSLELCRTRLEGFGPTLAAEKLAEVGLMVSHETLRRWLIVEGLWKKKRKRGPHRRWRPPKEHFGELVQMDGSFHDWLETGEKPCLIDMVDDGTSFMDGRFFEQETTEGAMRVLWGWIELYGIPRALYTDHKNLYVTDREPTVDEQLAGRPALTAFGKACHKLGIQIIPAASPQAKGRIERRHGVLQDRLVKELRLRGIKDLEAANGFRWGGKVYEGKYEPLISKATFDRVQRALDGRSRAKGRVHEFTYAGLVKCGTCGGLMSGDLKKGRYVYYRCAGTKGCKRFYPEKVLETETLRLLASLQIGEAVSEWLLGEIEKLHDQGMDEAALKRLVSRRKGLQGLQARAYEDKLLGKIDEAFWAERNAAWQTELAEVNGELLAIENAPPKADLLAAARKPVELLQVAPTLYVTQDPAEKARLLKTMVSNYTITDGSVSVVLRSPFDVLARGAKTGKWWS